MRNFSRLISITSCALLAVAMIRGEAGFSRSSVIGISPAASGATVNQQALVPNSLVYSGDDIRVGDGMVLVALSEGGRVLLAGQTAASFIRETEAVTLGLSHGTLSLSFPAASARLRIRAGTARITPVGDTRTQADVALLKGTLWVRTLEGAVHIEAGSRSVDVAKGRTVSLPVNAPRAPQQSSGAAKTAIPVLHVAPLAASGVAAVLGGVAASRAGSANDAAHQASANFQQAVGDWNTVGGPFTNLEDTANALACGVNGFIRSVISVSDYVPVAGC